MNEGIHKAIYTGAQRQMHTLRYTKGARDAETHDNVVSCSLDIRLYVVGLRPRSKYYTIMYHDRKVIP
jgi:hypothetical protein